MVAAPWLGRSLTVIDVALFTVKQLLTGVTGHGDTEMSVLPAKTSLAPVKAVPVRVTVLVPAVDPAVGETAVTVGTATYV
jgi:hypothetical protein